ncbi:MAG: ABC transporter permease [Deltaproteobacteria bacterium]|nr:ABC transporter permease [Deltaproteobacteria bacterium]
MIRRWMARIGYAIVALFALTALGGPLVAPYAADHLDPREELEPPSSRHLLGTGENGVDLLSSLLHGARLAGGIALAVVGISLVLGTTLGAVGGYTGGPADGVVRALIDVFMAFPHLILNVAFAALVARPGTLHLIAALCITGWVGYARVARAQVLALREQEIVTAARAVGVGPARIVYRHLVPLLVGPLIVQATYAAGGTILVESSLSFLGMGTTAASWGALLDQGTGYLLRTSRVAMVAGIAIAVTLLGFNLAGDALRDRLDPRSRMVR